MLGFIIQQDVIELLASYTYKKPSCLFLYARSLNTPRKSPILNFKRLGSKLSNNTVIT